MNCCNNGCMSNCINYLFHDMNCSTRQWAIDTFGIQDCGLVLGVVDSKLIIRQNNYNGIPIPLELEKLMRGKTVYV